MNQQDAVEQYMQTLKAMGMSDEMIAMYRQQMEQSMQASSQWASQLSQFGQNIQQFNAMFNGDALNENSVPSGNTLMLNPNGTLTSEQLWAISCGADIAILNGQYLNDLATGFSRQDCRELLSDWWDIDSKEEVLDTIDRLFSEGHRIQYDIIWQALNTVSIKESKAFLREYVIKNQMEEEVILNRLRNMRDALELFQHRGLIGKDTQPEMLIWDYARIINLTRGSFDAEYISREEALDIIMRCVKPIRSMYTSWKQLSLSYQFARCVWIGVEEANIDDMLRNMDILLTDKDSPWVKMSWNQP